MKVGDLIDSLKKYDRDTEVCVEFSDIEKFQIDEGLIESHPDDKDLYFVKGVVSVEKDKDDEDEIVVLKIRDLK